MIEIKDLHKAFGEQVVLNGVNLTVKDGQSMVVMGKSGTGKSVLLKLLTRLLYPDSGQILVDGDDLGGLQGKTLDACRSDTCQHFIQHGVGKTRE